MYKLTKLAYSRLRARSSRREELQQSVPPCSHQLRARNEAIGSTGVPKVLGQSDPKAPSEMQLKLSSQNDSQKPQDSCQIRRKKNHDSRVYRWKLVCGLFLPYVLASLDLTIVASALPFIASHFGKFDQLNWIVTAFNLTSRAFIPAFGQLAMFLMLIGSTLCAAAQTWGMLLLGRALQGTSSAGIMNIIMVILADKVSLKENAKNNTIFAFINGVSYSVGPVIGGYLTNDNWRYCFVISILIAFVSHILIFVLLRKELIKGTHFKEGVRRSSITSALATLDVFGIFLFIFGVGLIILGTAWGGATYPWTSAQVLAPLVVLDLISRRDTLLIAVFEFSGGAALYSVFYFIGIYFTLVEAYPASEAGVQLLYYIPGLGAGVYLAMYMCNVRPAQTFFPLTLGTIAETVGLSVLTWAIRARNTGLVNGMMVLAGAGTGLRFMPASLHIAGIWPEQIASATSLMRFSLPFGGTIGLTIMAETEGWSTFTTRSLDAIADLPAAQQEAVRVTSRDAVMWAFISIMPIIGISLITGFFLGNMWIKTTARTTTITTSTGTTTKQGHHDQIQEQSSNASKGRDTSYQENGRTTVDGDDDEEEEDIQHSEVIYIPYLYAWFKGDIDSYKHMTKPLSQKEKQRQALALREEIELRRQPKPKPKKMGSGDGGVDVENGVVSAGTGTVG
ncbi:hypothetical protein VTN00DRAFT_7845 [Thermoascus crustaceus]|uniref:uncharacterized protein n=1 Tax=Thermoascus crustaceus TaxID=5088 RepID=UPI003744141B